MFQRMINDLKDSTGTALRLTSLAAAAAGALFIATSFLCAAAFVFVYQRYGLVEACLTGAGVFSVVAVIAAGCYMAGKKQVEALAARASETAKSAMQTALSDPILVTACLQGIPATRVKNLIQFLAVGGLISRFLSSRHSSAHSH